MFELINVFLWRGNRSIGCVYSQVENYLCNSNGHQWTMPGGINEAWERWVMAKGAVRSEKSCFNVSCIYFTRLGMSVPQAIGRYRRVHGRRSAIMGSSILSSFRPTLPTRQHPYTNMTKEDSITTNGMMVALTDTRTHPPFWTSSHSPISDKKKIQERQRREKSSIVVAIAWSSFGCREESLARGRTRTQEWVMVNRNTDEWGPGEGRGGWVIGVRIMDLFMSDG